MIISTYYPYKYFMSLIILADKVLGMTFTTLSVVLNVVGMLNNTFFSKDVMAEGVKIPS